MYFDNTWYGARNILSKFCKISETEVFASIQHGHNLIDQKDLGKRTLTFTPWLVWNDRISKACIKRGYKNVIPIGSVILYFLKIHKLKNQKSKGTLVFPLLSQPEEKNRTNYLKLIEYVKKNFSGPYTISISIEEIKNLDKKYKLIKNVKFISWGYRGDNNYLKKLLQNIFLHKNIVSVYPGSPIIYSLFFKKKVYLLKNYFLQNKSKKKIIQIRRSLELNLKDFKKYNLNIKNLNDKKNYLIVKKILGVQFMKSKEELIKLLGWDSSLKKILSKIFSMLINVKHDLKYGYRDAKKRRYGRDFK